MSTPPCTVPKLVRWRVKDWASCFYACRFPLDEDKPDTFCSSSHQTSYETNVCNPKGQSSIYDKNKSALMDNKCNREKELVESFTDTKSAEIETEDSFWPRFAEEDYIVFCFRENGAIHVLNDRKSEADSDQVNCSNIISRPVTRKLIYDRNGEMILKSDDHEDMLNDDEKDIYPATEEDSIIISCDIKVEDEDSQHFDTELPADEIKELNHIEEIREYKIVSAESSDSNDQSEASTRSFAFPVLQVDWMGSPERMPKSKQHYSGKHRPRGVLQCCRF